VDGETAGILNEAADRRRLGSVGWWRSSDAEMLRTGGGAPARRHGVPGDISLV
jgi:hypothetical protein